MEKTEKIDEALLAVYTRGFDQGQRSLLHRLVEIGIIREETAVFIGDAIYAEVIRGIYDREDEEEAFARFYEIANRDETEEEKMLNEIDDARYNIGWVVEHLDAVGGEHKQVYIDAMMRVDQLLWKIREEYKDGKDQQDGCAAEVHRDV